MSINMVKFMFIFSPWHNLTKSARCMLKFDSMLNLSSFPLLARCKLNFVILNKLQKNLDLVFHLHEHNACVHIDKKY